MAPSKNTNASNNGNGDQPPPAKKRPIELVDVEENGAGEEKGEGFSEVQAKFKKFRKYLEEGGAYESLAKVWRFCRALFYSRNHLWIGG